MTTFQAFFLGLLQGLSEFLPISSSAHLTLTPWALGWSDPGLAFDVALHLGTLVAVLWYFRAEWVSLTKSGLGVLAKRKIESPDEWRAVFLLIGTVPAAIAGLALEEKAETVFRSPTLIATTLMLMGVLLWAADRYARTDRALKEMTWRDALLIGIAQAFALVPGVSRSGATITSGRLLRLDRQSAAVFSFLLSMPVTAAAALLKVPDALRAEGLSLNIVVGVVTAAASSWLAISILLKYVTRHSYGVFAAYRLALGVGVLLLAGLRG
jgi:undecaprenyl-diphosphatase